MKKLIAIFAIVAAFTGANAQSVNPRTGTGVNQDKTYRVLTFVTKEVTDASSIDTVVVNTEAFHTLVRCSAVKDTLNIYPKSLAKAYFGDELEIVLINTSGSSHLVKIIGGNVEFNNGVNGSIALTTAKRANIKFIFDGAKWVETHRVVQ